MKVYNKTVVYIEDDFQAGLLVKVFLEKAGLKVEICPTTREARELLATTTVDMIISDIGLPGESGVQFYEWITQSEYKEIPVFLVSAHAMGFSHVLTEHRDIFFEKPLFFPTFIEKIKETLKIVD